MKVQRSLILGGKEQWQTAWAVENRAKWILVRQLSSSKLDQKFWKRSTHNQLIKETPCFETP